MVNIHINRHFLNCLLILLHCILQVHGQGGFQLAQSDDCGKIDPDPNDPRTLVPWTASIFAKPGSRHPLKFLITGTIIGPTTVLTIFAGAYGEPLTKGSKYFIPPAENHIVGVGLLSNDLSKRDGHGQFSKVKHIVPYGGHDASVKEFHLFLFHLEKPLNLSSPFVRSACIPVFLKTLPTSAYGHKLEIIQGGFSSSQGTIVASNVSLIEPETKCHEIFHRHFRGSPHESLCGKPIPGGSNEGLKCTLYGSAPMVQVFNKRWFMLGITALIPKPSGPWCSENTVYFYAKITPALDWLVNNLKCSPNSFACGDGSCVPLNSVCNKKTDCSKTAADEDPIFCRARKPCLYSGKTIECGTYGPCIRPEQLCNGRADCDDGSDEKNCSPTGVREKVPEDYQNLELGDRQKPLKPKCAPLQASEGVVIDCKESKKKDANVDCKRAEPETVATFKCQQFYKSTYRLSSIEMECQTDGSWKPYRPFGCEVDCGILSNKIVPFIVHGQRATDKDAFPWHTTIFYKISSNDDFALICGGTLIEKSVLITAAHCVTDSSGSIRPKPNFKIVLGGKSSKFQDNVEDHTTQIFGVRNAWVPATYDKRTLQSDLAIVQLDGEAKYGPDIRPACYLQHGFTATPIDGSKGKVAGFGYNSDQVISKELHFAELPVISPDDCKRALKRVPPLQTFCAGYKNGTSVCQGDSGGGLVIPDKIGSEIRYVLKGLVSHGEVKAGRFCDNENYAVFTHIDDYADWILERLDTLRRR